MGSMNKIIFLLSIMFIVQAHAYEAIVIVLEAPLLRKPEMSSVVLQTIRKGQRVYVPNDSYRDETIPEYFQTYDRAGNTAFIPSRFVKVITEDENEGLLPITLNDHDPTDYRLEEPIPVTYPFSNNNYLRASFSFTLSNNSKSPYDYEKSFDSQNYRTENGGRLVVSKKVEHDKYDRFYFGFISYITTSKNKVVFTNQNIASEIRDRFRIGPYISYDVFKNEKYRGTFATGFTFNYHKTAIVVENETLSEERLFSGFSLSPIVSSNFQMNDVIPNTDFIAGMDLSLFLPHPLSTSENAEIPELWGEKNTITEGFKPQISAFIGFQVKY